MVFIQVKATYVGDARVATHVIPDGASRSDGLASSSQGAQHSTVQHLTGDSPCKVSIRRSDTETSMPDLPPELRKLDAAIAAQEGLRGQLPDSIVDATIAPLRSQRKEAALQADGSTQA